MSPEKTHSFPKERLLVIAGFSLILIALAFCGYKVHSLSGQQEKVKEDYSTANNVVFGLFSASVWRDKIEDVVTQQIQTFHLTSEQKQELKKEIEQILNSLIDKAINIIEKPKKSLGAKIKKAAFNLFVDEDRLHAQVPAFAEQIVTQIQNPSSKRRLKEVAQSEIEQLAKQTYDSSQSQERFVVDSLLHKYNVKDKDVFEKKTNAMIHNITHLTYIYSFGMLACVIVILLLWRILRKKDELNETLYILSIISAIIILLTGLTTTMIEVDARIQSLDFSVMGKAVSFENQVLFFQSKSIIDVVTLLLKTGKYDSMLVGVLILCFSVLFPVMKLLSTGIYLMSDKKWAKGKFIKYFAFKSGKWSMADVMVVAILMAYIGFNGILESQLRGLNIHTSSLSSITTNQTALQPGYIVFVAFVLYGLVLSEILKHITRQQT